MSDTVSAAAVLGRPLWYELLTTDMKAAGRFYAAVVGWTLAPFEGAGQPYDMFNRAGGMPVAGVMNIPPGMNFPPHWEMYIGVPNLDEAVATIERLGGSALSPVIDIPSVGRMRTMQDPQGAVFAVYQPAASPPGPDAPAEIGGTSWHELYTTDAAAALRFYGEVFGWKQNRAFDMGPMGTYHIFGRSFDMGGMMTKSGDMASLPTHWGIYFRVDDINAGAARITANGGTILNGPMEVPGGDWIVQAMDPQGAAFSLHQRPKSGQ